MTKFLGCGKFIKTPDMSSCCGDISFGNKILLCEKCKKKETARLLVSLRDIDAKKEHCTKDKDNDELDVKKFNLLSRVREVIKTLKLIDVDKKYLLDNFMLAGMVLIFNEEKLK